MLGAAAGGHDGPRSLPERLSIVMEIIGEPRESRITVGELAKQFALRAPDKDHGRDVTDCPVSRPVDGKEVRFPTLRSWAAFLACRPFWRNLREHDAVDFPPPSVAGAVLSDVFSVG